MSELAKSTREDIEEKVKKIILEHISKDVERFGSSSKLSDHGTDSLDAVEIISYLKLSYEKENSDNK